MPNVTAASPAYDHLKPPIDGETIRMVDGRLQVPDMPIIPFNNGDGTGPDRWKPSQSVIARHLDQALRPRPRTN